MKQREERAFLQTEISNLEKQLARARQRLLPDLRLGVYAVAGWLLGYFVWWALLSSSLGVREVADVGGWIALLCGGALELAHYVRARTATSRLTDLRHRLSLAEAAA